MSPLALHLLGSPRVELDGEPVQIPRRKALALLVYLAVTGRSHSRDSLAALLWPEYDQSSARTDLRRTLSVLNRTLGEAWLAADRETAGLSLDAEIWLDVDQFRQRLAACETHSHPPTEACPDCIPLLEEALALYRDHFLAGFTLRDSPAFDEWQFFQTEGLKDELAGALVRLTTYQTSQGDFDAAIGYARSWLALDPVHEPAHRHLMVLYAQSGQRAAALRQYEACRQLLADELGVEPAERTRETYERLLEGELPIGPSAVEAILERELRTVGECPYRGLAPFRESDAPFFFGREGFTERLAEAVRTRPMVAVIVGSSGSGKSSTVFAGLLPRLREEGDWLVAGLRPGAQPFHALAAALLPILEPELSEIDRLVETHKLADALSEEDVSLYDVVERALDKSAESNRLLLLIDQFEELYTLCPEPATRRDFVDVLLTTVEAMGERRESPFVLLLTMRADFMGQALAYRPFADALQESSLLLGPMTGEELRTAIEKPAEKQGAALETGLVERLLDDVGEEPGNLPLLEFALTLLWERLDFGWMTHAAYEEIGRVEGALARYAQQVYDDLAEGEREGARRIFTQLVQPGEETGDTRRVATRAELGDESWGLVQHLADKRLVVTGQDATTGGETVEVVHEALIQRWGQLRGWMDEDRAFRTWQERLRGALSQWQATGEDEGVLLRGAPLAEAEGWLDEREDELSTREKTFIRDSVALREQRQAERDRRRRRTILALAGGLVVALILVLLAGQQWQRAEGEVDARATAQAQEAAQRVRAETESEARATQQAIAEEQRHAALVQASIGLASQALLELEGSSPERAVPLALEALENYPYTWQAERALGQTVLGHRLCLFLRHRAPVRATAWSPDGTRILTAGEDQTVKIWDAAESSPTYGEEILTLSGHYGFVMSAAWSPSGDRILTGNADGTARVWDVSASSPTYGEELLWIRDPPLINTARWSPDGTRILTASSAGTAKVWDAATGGQLLQLSGHIVSSAAWSPSGDRIVTGREDGSAKVWDATTGEELFTLSGHTARVDGAAWSPDGSHVVTASEDGTAKVWDANTGAEVLTFSAHKFQVLTAAWSPADDRIATASMDGTVKVWSAATGTEIITLFGHTSDIYSVEWSSAGDRIASASEDGTAKVWDLDPTLLTIAGPSEAAVGFVAWSPEGDRVARGFIDGTVKVWDAAVSSPTYGEELLVLSDHTDSINHLDWSSSGDRILTASWDRTAIVWDASTGERQLTLRGHTGFGSVFAARWSPDDRRIVTTGYGDRSARVWDAETGEQLLVFTGQKDGVRQAAWSPDGKAIVTTSDDGTAKIWNATTGQAIRDLYPDGFGLFVAGVGWSPDGGRIATWGADGIGRIWDATTGEQLVTFTGHANVAWGIIGWSDTGERILTNSGDGTARVWDAATGVELLRYDVGSGLGAAWSPDGKRVATASMDGALRVFPAWQTTQELIDYAKECCVVRELTDEEREQFGLVSR